MNKENFMPLIDNEEINYLEHRIEDEKEYMKPYQELLDAFENVYADDFTKEEDEIINKAYAIIEKKLSEYRSRISNYEEEIAKGSYYE